MSKNSSKPRNKHCPICGKEKSFDQFNKNKAGKFGLETYCRMCKSIKVKQWRLNQQTGGGDKLPRAGAIGFTSKYTENDQDKDLNFLLDIQRPSKVGWTYQQASHLIDGLQEAAKTGVIDFKRVFAKHGSGKTEQACFSLLKELKEATKNKMNLKAYWKANRPFRPGGKVLLEGKK